MSVSEIIKQYSIIWNVYYLHLKVTERGLFSLQTENLSFYKPQRKIL